MTLSPDGDAVGGQKRLESHLCGVHEEPRFELCFIFFTQTYPNMKTCLNTMGIHRVSKMSMSQQIPNQMRLRVLMSRLSQHPPVLARLEAWRTGGGASKISNV